jgi:hypothetical protein
LKGAHDYGRPPSGDRPLFFVAKYFEYVMVSKSYLTIG